MRWTSPDPEATRRLARALGRVIRGGVVALVGPLGAGKTVFVKGLAEGLGLDPAAITSPTFVIANEYPLPASGPVSTLVHLDLYRLGSEAELEGVGFGDWLVDGVVVAVEWGDRFPAALPADRLEVELRIEGTGRSLEARALGGEAKALLDRWQREARC